MRSDRCLLQAWRAGDVEAGDALIRRHAACVRGYFEPRARHEVVDDLVQWTFVACVEGRDRCAQRSSFRVYVLGVARNVLRVHYRSQRRALRARSDRDLSRVLVAAPPEGPDELVERRRRQRELVVALKDPVENYGMLLTEIVSRVRSRVITEDLDRAHPKLKRAAVHIEDKAQAFGEAVERLLRHFGKTIIDEQMLLERVSDIAIDLYAMVAVVSRATRALEQDRRGAAHEATLAAVFCEQADRRIRRRLRALEQGRKNGDVELRAIADALLDAGAYLPKHPVL